MFSIYWNEANDMDLWITVALLIVIIIILLLIYRFFRFNKKHHDSMDDTDGMFLLNKGKHEDKM